MNGARILIADDNEDTAGVLKTHLASLNHDIVVVGDGFQLAKKASELSPHLIITDIQMPGAYGSSVYAVLRKDPKTANIPVLFISGHPYEKVRPILPKDPKTRFVEKPFTFAKLEELVNELLPLGGYLP